MALLVVDVFTHGAVMSADSQPVEILDGQNRILRPEARHTGFVGLLGVKHRGGVLIRRPGRKPGTA